MNERSKKYACTSENEEKLFLIKVDCVNNTATISSRRTRSNLQCKSLDKRIKQHLCFTSKHTSNDIGRDTLKTVPEADCKVNMNDDLKDVKIILSHQDRTFEPGILSGILEMCPNKSVVIKEVRMKLFGQAYISIAGSERREDFIDILQTIFPILDKSATSQQSETTLDENVRYTLPFKFQLMNHLPSSLEHNSPYSGLTAYVRYYIESTVIRSQNAMASVCRREFKFCQTRDLANSPDFATPKMYQKSYRSGLFGSASVHLTCTLHRVAFYLGETIALNITVDNSERKDPTRFVIAQLVQEVGLIEKENDHPSLHKCTTVKVLQSLIAADSIEMKKRVILPDVLLKIEPAADSIPSIETRKSLMFNYAVFVKVIIHEKSKLSLKIPITVARRSSLLY